VPALCLLAAACSANGDSGRPSGAAGATGGAGSAGSGSGDSSGSSVAGSSSGSSAGSTAVSSVGSTAAGSAGSVAAGSPGGAGVGTGGTAGALADDGGAMGATDSGGIVTTGDAGGVGAFGYSGASRCATAGVLLCESFENGIDGTVWMPLTTPTTPAGDGTAVVDDLHAARGTKALHVKVINAGHKAAISETKTFPIANNVLFARMFVWFDAFTTNVHFTMAEAPQVAAGAWIRFGGQFGKFGVGTDHGASGDWLQPDTVPVPTKKWTCIEFEFKGDTNEFHVWQDDVERTALNVGATKHAGFVIPPMTSLWFGWQTYSNQAPGELWIDEIAIDSKPIGCAK